MKRLANLLSSSTHKVTIARYQANELHPLHRDPHSRASILLSGSFVEKGSRGTIIMQPGDILLKSHQALHEDHFGASGAVIAAIEFYDDPFVTFGQSDLLHRRADNFAFHHALALVEAAYAGASDMALAAGMDLLTACLDESSNSRKPPLWLKHLKEEIEFSGFAGVDIAARARAGGVHPTHASRLFRRCFGVSITEHVRAHSIRRALPLIARPKTSLSQAALEAGFYDQSHMNRVFNRVLGRTPSAMRGLLTRAAC